MRPTIADDQDASKLGSKQVLVKQYLVKWKGLSYLHCTWYLFLTTIFALDSLHTYDSVIATRSSSSGCSAYDCLLCFIIMLVRVNN